MYLLYLFAWKVIGILPEKTAYQLANFVSDQILRKNENLYISHDVKSYSLQTDNQAAQILVLQMPIRDEVY